MIDFKGPTPLKGKLPKNLIMICGNSARGKTRAGLEALRVLSVREEQLVIKPLAEKLTSAGIPEEEHEQLLVHMRGYSEQQTRDTIKAVQWPIKNLGTVGSGLSFIHLQNALEEGYKLYQDCHYDPEEEFRSNHTGKGDPCGLRQRFNRNGGKF